MATTRPMTSLRTSSRHQADNTHSYFRDGDEGLNDGIELTTQSSIASTTRQVSRSSAGHRSGSDYSENRRQNPEREQSGLPAADGGLQAWMMLAASALIQVPVWGYSVAFGVFQEYYSDQDGTVLKGNKGSIATIGTTYTGILYLLSPITFTLLTCYPKLRPYFGPTGMALLTIGFLLSSFATQIWQLIVTQGVISAIGAGLLFTPMTLYLDEWFIRRKGLAYGLMWAAKSISGAVLPFVSQICLDRFGAQTTLRAWVVAIILTTLPVVKFIKPRIPVTSTSASSSRPRPIDLSFLHLPAFWMLQFGNVIQSFGYFLPQTYLPSYTTTTIGLSATMGTLIIALFGTSAVIGGIILGTACDRFNVTNVMLISSVGSALSVWLFWGLSMPVTQPTTSPPSSSSSGASPATTIALLILFAIFYGFFAGGFSSTWSGILKQLKAESPGIDTGFMFGLLAGGRGIGNVISGPLSSALLSAYDGYSAAASGVVSSDGMMAVVDNGYKSQYGGVIVFTGVTALLGGWSWLWGILKKTVQIFV